MNGFAARWPGPDCLEAGRRVCMMDNRANLTIYRRHAPIYDRWMRLWTAGCRGKAIEYLDLKPGERLLIPGVGTGLDLPYLPADLSVTGVDLSPEMLGRARDKGWKPAGLCVMDGQLLAFSNRYFDAVLLNLILSVVPDGKKALEEAWRVLRPGGRAVVFDKFLPEGAQSTVWRELVGGLIRRLGTDPNRRFSDMVRDLPDLLIEKDEPVLLQGQYRILLLTKLS